MADQETVQPRQMILGLEIDGSAVGVAWRRRDSQIEKIGTAGYYSAIANLAEAAKLHFLFRADSASQDLETIAGTPPRTVEAFTLLALLAATTRHVGLIGTASSSFNDPYNIARIVASLDHLSGGRAGCNLVVSQSGHENFGDGRMPPHSARYARAEEFIAVVRELWDSWDGDALVVDRTSGVYADPGRVHAIHHHGTFFHVRGPLNTFRSPQGRPVVVQAGASPAGRDFAARHADLQFTLQPDETRSRQFYRDMKQRAVAAGRPPGSLRVIVGANFVVADTAAEARDAQRQLMELADLEAARNQVSVALGGADLSALELDDRIPLHLLPRPDALNAGQSHAETYAELVRQRRLTLRQLIYAHLNFLGHWTIVGTPSEIADQLEARLHAGAADGFMLIPSFYPSGLPPFLGSVIPILQERGSFHADYAATTLRDELGLSETAQRSVATPGRR